VGLRLENVDIFYGNFQYFTDIWDIDEHLVHFVLIWYIFSGFGSMYQEKSGNPVPDLELCCRHEKIAEKI
jgi:hypothetical protein